MNQGGAVCSVIHSFKGRGHPNLLNLGHKLIKFGIHGYSWVLHEYSDEICGYSRHFT